MNPIRPSFIDFASGNETIAIVGLGYVGLPLAALFARKFRVIGFDINAQRITELEGGLDRTRELSRQQLEAAKRQRTEDGGQTKGGESDVGPGLIFSTDPKVLSKARLIIVTVPTPIDDHKNPDLTPLVKSSTMIGRHIAAGTTVVYESTVYPEIGRA